MSIDALVELVHSPLGSDWQERNQAAFDGLFGAGTGRYPAAAKGSFRLRAPDIKLDSGIPFSAYIHPENPTSGQYAGLSFVLFPVEDGPCLLGFVVGTGGLGADQEVLGRPGHARKAQAICAWLNREYGKGGMVAWAKQDPTRTDIGIPADVTARMANYKRVFDRYGKEMYAIYRPTEDRAATKRALEAFLDVLVQERGAQPLAGAAKEAEALRRAWAEHLMPGVEEREVADLLRVRRFVVLQGPPGTGKTKMAMDLLRKTYGGCGRSIQFHPNTTYENFIGGLGPKLGEGEFGLQFAPAQGFLMQAAARAMEQPDRPYLLHIDEINRADLGKILGEAILLLEPKESGREIELPHDFGAPFGRRFRLPENLHLLGTMNSSDRSIAIVDIAVRRRFAFVSLWPRTEVVKQHGCALMQTAFGQLLGIFVEHATDDALALMPGHSYFLESDEEQAKRSLRVNLKPLLEEYLAQGYVSGFAEPIRSYLQWLDAQ